MVAPATALMRGDRKEGPSTHADRVHSPLARRWLLNLALLMMIGGLAVFAWYRSTSPPAETRAPLTAIQSENVHRVIVERMDQPTIGLERGEDGWRLVEPVRARADQMAIDSLLRIARAPIESTIATTDADLARYGLDRPATRLRLDDAEIQIGDMHPLRDTHYVRYGAAVYLVPSRYVARIAPTYTTLLDSRLIEHGRRAVSFKLPGFTLTRNNATWERQPPIADLSSDRINAFIDDWQHARALQVQKSTGQRAREQVLIHFEDGTTLTVGIAARSPELILVRADEGLEYHFPTELGDRLLRLVPDSPK